MSHEVFLENAKAFKLTALPCLEISDFYSNVSDSLRQHWRVSSYFALNSSSEKLNNRLIIVLANENEKMLKAFSTEVKNSFESLASEFPQVELFEREIYENCGITPVGHPRLNPVRKPSNFQFFRFDGSDIHEVAVGPVHAGVIEPGHFRFQCYGERVLHLQIALGYQHRGIEKALIGGPDLKTPYLIETLAGDTTVGHSLAYCQAIEGLKNIKVPLRAHVLRAIGLELERLANHTGDLGALGGDVGYLPTSSYCGRIRGDFLNMTALLCGSRLGRGFLRPGGSFFDLDTEERRCRLQSMLENAQRDARSAIQLLWDSPSVMTRFENTGRLSRETCVDLGLVGPAARACGVFRDVRRDFPTGIYGTSQFPTEVNSDAKNGDVASRALVRWHEVQESLDFIQVLLEKMPSGPVCVSEKDNPCISDAMIVSLVEGWRGEICHVAITDEVGRFKYYKVVDPSFHNWNGLEMALREQEISDFPLCNKSFNLSYCGFDL